MSNYPNPVGQESEEELREMDYLESEAQAEAEAEQEAAIAEQESMTTPTPTLPADIWNRPQKEIDRHESLLKVISDLMDKNPPIESPDSMVLEHLANAVELYETKCVQLSTQKAEIARRVKGVITYTSRTFVWDGTDTDDEFEQLVRNREALLNKILLAVDDLLDTLNEGKVK